jgi:hypothetical protein
MPFESTVYRILIASPSDVEEEREVTSRIIQDWNDLNSFNKKIVLLPVKWETHSSPIYGVRPQEAINRQIVDDCDLLIGFFWTKIGSPTGEELSGTIEEIKRVSSTGKPVMLYFSKRGKDPSQIETSQLQSLNKFKEEVYKIALVESFNSIVDFRDKVSRQLEMKIRELESRKSTDKDLASFSFIDKLTGKLLENKLEIEAERIEVDEKKIQALVKTDKRLTKKKWAFNDYFASHINMLNNIPILLGMENNTNGIIGNALTELKLKCSIDDSIIVQSINTENKNNVEIFHQSYLSKENQNSIIKLFKNDLTQTSPSIWELNLKPFSILPNKIKILDSVIILYPKESMKINFSIVLFSENILQPVERTITLNVKLKKRAITDKEIDDFIKKLPEEDDLPF